VNGSLKQVIPSAHPESL